MSAGLPHNWDIERAVLGGIMLDARMVEVVAPLVVAEHFSRPQHAALYRLLCELAERGTTDPGSVADEVARRGQEAFGGIAYVLAMPSLCMALDHVEGHARRVRDYATRRKLDMHAAAIRERIAEGVETPEVLDFADGGFRDLAQVARAERPPSSAAEMARAAMDEAREMAEHPRAITGLDAGFTAFTTWFRGLQRGHVYVLGGRPKMGKTSFADAVVVNVARRAGVTCGWASMEMAREDLGRRRLASASVVALDSILTGRLTADDIRRMSEAEEQLADLRILTDDRAGLTASQLRLRWRSVARDYPDLGMLAVDYLQRMGAHDPRWDMRRIVAYNSAAVADLAGELGVAVLLLSQLTRAVESRSDKRPMPSDFMESGSIEADASAILTVYRDEVYVPESADKGIAEINCVANRHGMTGRTKLYFSGEMQRWTQLAEPGMGDGYY